MMIKMKKEQKIKDEFKELRKRIQKIREILFKEDYNKILEDII